MMCGMKLFGIPVRIHPVTLPLAALAMWLGEGERLGVMAASILLHELAHVLAARIAGVRVLELELTPVGGAARLENMWRLRPGQTVAVALAGPACSLLLAAGSAALCWWGLMHPRWTAVMIEQNFVILAFNMLPALPLDGGRTLCGLLGRRLAPAAAARLVVRITQGVAAGLLALSVYGLFFGKLNITLPAAAAYLLMSCRTELRQAAVSVISSMNARTEELEHERVLPVRWLAARSDASVRETAARMRPGYMHLVAVFDGDLKLCGMTGENDMLRALIMDSDICMGELMRNVKSKIFEKRC